jgi:hypothetical protein
MTDVEEAYDEDEEEAEELGPSLAMPPLYVLRTAERCPECGRAMHVYTLGCAAFHDAEDSRPLEVFHFLSRIRSVPEAVLKLLKARCPGYDFDSPVEGEPPYLMNHCDCGAKLDHDFLHGDIGAAFWPDTPEGFGLFKLFRLPIEEAIPIVCEYSVGGGEYLDYGHAEAW